MGETNDNNYCFFEAAGMKFMVVSLEFAPRDEALKWAAGAIERHPDHRVIVATHCYMSPTGRENRTGEKRICHTAVAAKKTEERNAVDVHYERAEAGIDYRAPSQRQRYGIGRGTGCDPDKPDQRAD